MSLEHEDIEAGDLIGRYRAGRLDPPDAEAFEEHYLHCSRCLDQLEADAEIGDALRRAAAQDVAAVTRPLAVVAWLARLGRSGQLAALVGTLLVAVTLPLLWQQRRLTDLAHERDAARWAAEAAGRAVPPPGAGEAGLAQERVRIEADRERLAQELAEERRAHADAEQRLSRALEPQANTPIVRLSPLRSLGGEPADRLRLEARTGWVVLALELPVSDYPSYRVRLTRAGAPVWSHAGLVPDAEGTLALSVHASALVPGDYETAVEGLAPDGRAVPAGRFSLRVVGAGARRP